MSADFYYPAAGVRNAAPLYAGKRIVKHLRYFADLTVVNDDLFAVSVKQPYRRNDSGGSGAENLVKLARFVRFKQLVYDVR